jgi:hypothetical protein
MAVLAPVPGVARIVFKGNSLTVPVANVIHVQNGRGDAWSKAELDGVATAARNSFQTRFLPLINNNYHLTEVDAVDLTSDLGVVSTALSSGVGAKVGIGTVNSVAQCISWKTDAHFRGGHARMYLCGPGSGDYQDATTWQPTQVSALLTAANGFLQDIFTAFPPLTPQYVLVRRTKNRSPLIPPQTFVLRSAVVDTRIDSQRRRLGKDR